MSSDFQGSGAWNGSQIGIAVLVGAAVLLSSVNARGANGGLASCSYQYSRWQATESAYWRDLYNVCVNVADERPLD
jgi:hypothetical protein